VKIGDTGVAGTRSFCRKKPVSGRLARPRKRHYTFARRAQDQFALIRVRHGAFATSKR
jgi:plasmid stabilization system protein ParE